MPKAFALMLLAYVTALGLAMLTGSSLSGRSPITIAFTADIAATLVIYLFGRAFRNSSFYDPYWSLAPIAIAVYWLLTSHIDITLEQVIIVFIVCVWGLRLTWNWAAGWRGLGHEDWRYTDLRRRTNRWFWAVELLGIDLMPTLVVFLGSLSLYPVLTSSHAFAVLDAAAIVISTTAIMIESVADAQLTQFGKTRRTGEFMESGLWAHSRHPNYLGEIMFWWGLYLFALASGINNWWMIVGPLTVTALFVFISVPMMDKHMAERSPAYSGQRQGKPAILPRLIKI